jgi:tetratricopeptide (TPR) repeat protein
MVKMKEPIAVIGTVIAACAVAVAVAIAVLTGCATSGGNRDEHELSLGEAIAQSAAAIADKLPAGTRVAVIAFESPHGNLSGYIMDELVGVLVDGSLEVADRNNLAYVYRELDFQMSGDVNDKSAQSIGKFLGAQYVITGQLVDTGGEYRYRLNGINVETAVHESSTRLEVRNDRRFRELAAALQQAAPEVRIASYGVEGSPAPRTPGTFLDRGITFASRDEYALAIADFTEAIRLDPDMAAAWLLRGRAQVASAALVTGVGENFSSIGTTITKGAAVSETKEAAYDRAIADITEAIRLDPGNARAYQERAGAYHQKGDYDRAIADFTKAIQLDSEYHAAYNNRGLAYSHKGEYDNAIADLNHAIRLDPDRATVYRNRGGVYRGKGDYDKAIADLDHAIRLDPAYAIAYNERGYIYNRKGEYDSAIADFDRAIELDYEYAVAYRNRGDAYKNKGEPDKAIADYTRAIRINPGYATAYNQRGLAFRNKGELDIAIADYTEAIRINPGYAIAFNNRGFAYNDKGEVDSAIADYTEALRLDPDDAVAYHNRGIAYYGKKDYIRARADWEKALEINPDYAAARRRLEALQREGY